MQSEKPHKIVLVGDPMVGKSSFCKSYVNKSAYKKLYQPTISETHEVSILLGNKNHPIILWEPPSLEEWTWTQLRVKDYVDTDCFLLCYSVDNYTSLENIETKWLPELRLHCPWVPVVLVGMKKDLRTPSNFVTRPEEGLEVKSREKLQGHIECSSFSISSIESVLILGLSTILETKNNNKPQRPTNSKCKQSAMPTLSSSHNKHPKKERFCDVL